VDTGLTVALISGAVALASAAIAARAQVKVKRLEQTAEEEEKRSQARIVLDRYRGPLLDAAWDLGDRIDNIIDRGFLSTYGGGERQGVAMTGTLFRLAQYFGWAEIVRREVQLLRFESDDTRRTAYFLSLVMRRFATDWYDTAKAKEQAKAWIEGYDEGVTLPPHHLMLWQEEQRGIGELMIEADGAARCVGYATFTDEYKRSFSRLLAGFKAGLREPDIEQSLRLVELRDALARLVEQLDDEKRYVTGQPDYETWLKRAHDSPCWSAYGHPAADPEPEPPDG
jgi:hypothetical protein